MIALIRAILPLHITRGGKDLAGNSFLCACYTAFIKCETEGILCDNEIKVAAANGGFPSTG